MSAGGAAPAVPAIGVILPSSNRVVERATHDVLSHLPGVDACFTRIAYFGDGQGQPAGRYDETPFLAAAELLAHARVGVIVWNATRGAALGFTPDEALCAAIERRAGLPAVTTALATLDVLRRFDIGRVALVTHGTPAQGAVFAARFGERGIAANAQLDLGFEDNFAAAQADPARIAGFARQSAARGGIDALLIWSTNLPGYAFAAELERQIGLPVLDSAAIGVWAALHALKIDMRRAACRGRLFGAA